MLAVYAIVNEAWLAGAAAVVLLGGFVLREWRAAAPLLPLRTFRSVAGVNVVLALLAAAMFAFLFFVVLYLVSLGYSPLATGLAMVPVAAAIGVVSLLLSARLNVRFGESPVLLAGLALIVLGLSLIAFAPGPVVVTSGYRQAFALAAMLVVAAVLTQGLTKSARAVQAVSRSTPTFR
jgi:hypothetical protein